MTDHPRGTHLDVLAVGVTYRDLIFTGLERLPRLGEENHAVAFHETWGGIATMARVSRALGRRSALCTPLGDDPMSARLVADMADQGIDTALSRVHRGWRLPVTVALSTASDRAMTTVEEPPPHGVSEHLDAHEVTASSIIVDLRDPALPWLTRARTAGSKVYASRGFDATGRWDREALGEAGICDVWMLNELEATAFTGASDATQAARRLAEHVPLVVVTRGADGMVAVDAGSGEEAAVSAFPVRATGTTGAGDSSLASFAFANGLPGLSLAERLDLTCFVVSAILSRPLGAADPPSADELIRLAERHPDQRARGIAVSLASRGAQG